MAAELPPLRQDVVVLIVIILFLLFLFQTPVNEKRCLCRHNHTRSSPETNPHVARRLGVILPATPPPPALDDTHLKLFVSSRAPKNTPK